MSVSGGEATRLRKGHNPTWSPDGTKLAFECYPGICVMDPDGSNVERLTEPRNGVVDEEPAWGPNGNIAFTRSYLDGRRSRDIFMIRTGGGPPIPLSTKGSNFSPAWSPDGLSLAFIRGLGKQLEAPPGGFQLWTMAVTGASLRQLTKTGASRPDWSPDGRQIVYDFGSVVWVMPALGGTPVRLEPATTGEHPDVGAFPNWSPDGSRIAYTCQAGKLDDNDLCIMNADGTGRTTILDTPANEAVPAWQPSERRQEYVSSFVCPELIPPGSHPRETMRSAVEAYLDAHQLPGTKGYSYGIDRLTRRVTGGPDAKCSRSTWHRSFVVDGHFKYVGSPKNPSASLSYFRIIVGRTDDGWVVWAVHH